MVGGCHGAWQAATVSRLPGRARRCAALRGWLWIPGAGFKPAPTLTAGVEAGRAAKDAIALAIARNALTMVALHCSAKDVAADFHIMARRNSHDGLKLSIRPGSSKEQILTIHTPLCWAKHLSRKGNWIESNGNRDGECGDCCRRRSRPFRAIRSWPPMSIYKSCRLYATGGTPDQNRARGLRPLWKSGNLRFRHSDEVAEELGEVALVAVGTPPGEGYSVELKQVEKAIGWVKGKGGQRPGAGHEEHGATGHWKADS